MGPRVIEKTGPIRSNRIVPMSILDRDWRIESLLGSGSFGHVYRARHIHDQDQVAIKVFHSTVDGGYLKELGLFFQTKHPHLIQTKAFGYHKGLQYLVYEYMPGGTLRNFLRQQPRVPVIQSVRIIQEVAQALLFMHTRHVVHRDLKPENILLTTSSWPFHIKLCDFGHARRCKPTEKINSSFGSMGYMAPEQYQDEYDSRVDIYALGVILYEMLFGMRPTWRQEHGTTPQEPLQLGSLSHYPPMLAEIFQKTLALDPDARYQTVAAFLKTLEVLVQLLEQEQVTPTKSVSSEFPAKQEQQTDGISSDGKSSDSTSIQPQWTATFDHPVLDTTISSDSNFLMLFEKHILAVTPEQEVINVHTETSKIERLISGSCLKSMVAWQTESEIIWHRQDEYSVLPNDTFKDIRDLLLHPASEQLLVMGQKTFELYDLTNGYKWLAQMESYGQLPSYCFSEDGNMIWVTMEVPRPQLVAMSTEGEMLCRVSLPGRDIAMLATGEKLLLGARGQTTLYQFSKDGMSEKTVNLPAPLFQLHDLDSSFFLIQYKNSMQLCCKQTLQLHFSFSIDSTLKYHTAQGGVLFGVRRNPESTVLQCDRIEYKP